MGKDIRQEDPRLSVCLPTYNGARFVWASIESILRQSYADIELIVSDDASTDGTWDVVSGIRDERVRVYRNPSRLGLVGNWNRCLDLAQGQYVTVFHQDDVMLSKNLALKIAMLNANPSVGFVYSNIVRIDSKGQVIGGHYLPQPQSDMVLPGWRVFAMVASTGNPIACQTVVARKECYDRLGLFDPRLPFATDLEMWMRIAKAYDVGYLDQPLVALRRHDAQETTRFQGTSREYKDVLRALDIAFSSHLPKLYSQYASESYRTLCQQSMRMARWMLRQRKIAYCSGYVAISVISLFRMCCHLIRSK